MPSVNRDDRELPPSSKAAQPHLADSPSSSYKNLHNSCREILAASYRYLPESGDRVLKLRHGQPTSISRRYRHSRPLGSDGSTRFRSGRREGSSAREGRRGRARAAAATAGPGAGAVAGLERGRRGQSRGWRRNAVRPSSTSCAGAFHPTQKVGGVVQVGARLKTTLTERHERSRPSSCLTVLDGQQSSKSILEQFGQGVPRPGGMDKIVLPPFPGTDFVRRSIPTSRARRRSATSRVRRSDRGTHGSWTRASRRGSAPTRRPPG